mmetsp:Transcript_44888/g.81914  ORF Transcript_44888/g.81914 Transcript_44888/m.81914 type:complete len:311 (+) Transcript_44888:110-1042(+)
MQEDETFNAWIVTGLCAVATCTWCVAHVAAYPNVEDAKKVPKPLLWQRRKLRRYFVYVILASVLGILLVIHGLTSEDDLLVALCCSFSRFHQAAFALAIGHWTVAVVEDFYSARYLGADLSKDGLALFPLNVCCSPNMVMLFMYTLHHVMTILAYAYSLCTHLLGGVMVQGLLFEIPVIFMVRREIALCESTPPKWLLDPNAVRRHWLYCYTAFALGRGPAEVLWVLSWIPGVSHKEFYRDDHFDDLARVLFHTFAVFFTSLNIRIVGLFLSWQAADMARAQRGLTSGDMRDQTESHDLPDVIGMQRDLS